MTISSDIEEIKKLKYRYLRLMDQHRWDEMEELFIENATSSYEGGIFSFDNRAKIGGMVRQYMDDEDLSALHHVHHPEIELTSPTTAKAIWAFEDRYIQRKHKTTTYGSGFYEDELVKVDGRWLFKHSGHRRVCECQESLPEDFELVQACDYKTWRET